MKFVSIFLFLMCTVTPAAFAAEKANDVAIDPVLGEKKVLCEIDFQPDSYTLSELAMARLDLVVDQLKNIDTSLEAIRIEGYIGESDTISDKTRLSLLRALAVEEYLRITHNARFDHYLTGHKNTGFDCQVKILVYKNPWQVYDAPIQVTNRGSNDGPS